MVLWVVWFGFLCFVKTAAGEWDEKYCAAMRVCLKSGIHQQLEEGQHLQIVCFFSQWSHAWGGATLLNGGICCISLVEFFLLNHRMVGVGRDLCGSSSPSPLPKQGHLQKAAQDLVQPGLEYLQRRRLHNLSGQPVPVLHHPQSEEVLLYECFFIVKELRKLFLSDLNMFKTSCCVTNN